MPLLDFLDGLKPSDVAEVRAALGLLAGKGHELRPPLNEQLGDQISCLRINGEDGTHRVFYWPFGKGIVVLGHGFSKEAAEVSARAGQAGQEDEGAVRGEP